MNEEIESIEDIEKQRDKIAKEMGLYFILPTKDGNQNICVGMAAEQRIVHE